MPKKATPNPSHPPGGSHSFTLRCLHSAMYRSSLPLQSLMPMYLNVYFPVFLEGRGCICHYCIPST